MWNFAPWVSNNSLDMLHPKLNRHPKLYQRSNSGWRFHLGYRNGWTWDGSLLLSDVPNSKRKLSDIKGKPTKRTYFASGITVT